LVLEQSFLFPRAHPGIENGAGLRLRLGGLQPEGEKPLDLLPAVPSTTARGADGAEKTLLLPLVQGVAVEGVALPDLVCCEEKWIYLGESLK